MSAHVLVFGDEAREAMMAGLDTLADAVKTTLGPRGRNVALDRPHGVPLVVNDGVTVAREIDLADPIENLGARIVREAAERAETVTGDGTTTATVLAQAIVHAGFRNVAAGANPIAIKRGLDRARVAVDEAITAAAIPVEGLAALTSIASISANDPRIGTLIGEVMEHVGRDGAVTVEESSTLTDEVDYVEGMQFERGYLSPYFVTDAEHTECVLDKPRILITDRTISALGDILPILEKLIAAGTRELLIIAANVEGEALAALVVNRLRGVMAPVAVKTPGFGGQRQSLLGDLAVMVGATVISEESGRRLESTDLADLGSTRRVIVTQDETTIVEGRGDPEAIAARKAEIRAQLEAEPSEYEREELQKRLARLAGSVAVIRIGASTEVELKEKTHRVEDAVAAARAALETGIVPGGGVVLLNAAATLGGLALAGDEAVGADCLRRALEEPMRQIAENAGYDGAVVVEAVRRLQKERGQPRLGFDAVRGDYRDMVDAGIVDPAKVTHAALDAAVSVASMMLTTEAMVSEEADGEAMA